MTQNIRQRRVLCKDSSLRPSADDPTVLRVLPQPPAPPPKRAIREDAPQIGAAIRIALWLVVVAAAMAVKIGHDTGLLR